MPTSTPTAVRFQKRILPNGLTIVAEENPSAHTSAVGFFVRAGARDEDPALMGVSHFLEHMMFKGTARRSADDVNREFDEIGANYNAFTSQEITAYWAQVLPEFLPNAVDLICDMLRPALRDDDFEMEKKVILEEISMYEDRPAERLQDVLLETYFGKHPLGYRVLGHKETVAALTPEQMRGYFQKRYSADNIVISLAGTIPFEKTVEQITKATEAWKPSHAPRLYSPSQPAQLARSLTDEKVTRQYIAMICPGPTAQDESRYAARILSDVLGDSEGSRLYWALVDPGLADSADLSHYPQDKAGSYFAFASCDPERAEQVEELLLKTIEQYVSNVMDEEIQRAKNKIATLATLQGESPAGRMRGLGSQWLYLGQYSSLEEELSKIMAVTANDIRDLLEQYPFSPRTIVRLGPAGDTTAAAKE